MARARKYGEDLTYSEWHRNALPLLYIRTGHRLAMANRDDTEFCHFCYDPIGIVEEVVDRGQDLSDKCTTITERLAKRANIPALFVAPRFDRPAEVQARINELNVEIRRLEGLHPITSFRMKRIWPHPSKFERLAPEDFAAEIHLLHRDHHQHCSKAQRSHPVYKEAAINAARAKSYVWVPMQQRINFGKTSA